MPIKKTRLTREERAGFLLRARELQAAGLECEIPNACEIPNETQENFQDLDIFVAGSEGNILCELPSGVTAYAIWVRLTALRSNLRLEDCRIVSEWDPESITLCHNEKGVYLVGQAVYFTRDEALNQRMENGLRFHDRGDVADGWLVASGLNPIPDNYRNSMITKLGLTFTDQFGNDFSAQAQAMLQRSRVSKDSDLRIRNSPRGFDVGHRETEDGYRETASNRSIGRTQASVLVNGPQP
jgi:hypothetical protein